MALSEESSRRRRATFNQLETLWEFLNSHREIATGYNKTAQARSHSRRMWESVAEALNSQGEGAVKDWKGWSSYWVDYKSKLKRRAAVVRASENRTGGGPLDVAPLSNTEKKFLGILGDGFGIGLPNIQVDPFPTLPQSSYETASIEEPFVIQVEEVPLQENLQGQEIPQEEPHEALQPPSNPSIENEVEPSDGPQTERRRRRRRRQDQMSQEEARRSLVEVVRERLRLEHRNARTWEHMLSTLQSIAHTLDRIASGPQSRNEGAPDS